MKKIFTFVALLMIASASAWADGIGFNGLSSTTEVVDPVESCEIMPAVGLYDALPTEWVITYGGRKLSVKEGAEAMLTSGDTEYPLNIMLDEEDDTKVIVTFDGQSVTTPGVWLVEIPGRTISIEGTPINEPQSFKYTVRNPVEFTTDPEAGEVTGLEIIFIKFANYYIEKNNNTKAYLFNKETEEVVGATVEEIAGRMLMVTLAKEVSTPGEWQLKVAGVIKSLDMSVLPDIVIDYTIANSASGIESLNAAIRQNGATIYNLNGQRVQNAQRGLYIVNGHKVVIK